VPRRVGKVRLVRLDLDAAARPCAAEVEELIVHHGSSIAVRIGVRGLRSSVTQHREALVLRVQRLAVGDSRRGLLGLPQSLFGAQALGELVLERASALLKTRDLALAAVDAPILMERLGWNDSRVRSTNSIERIRIISARKV
jgi:hypothetical protein